jgi:integrase
MVPFTIAELNRLLKKPAADAAMRWIPLIGLFSGMRLNEVCGLRVGDVKPAGRIWYFDVTEEGGRRVKTEAARRAAPIHSTLIACGLKKYPGALPKDGLLFPALKPGGPDGKLSWYFSKRFTGYRRACGIDRPRVSFHSLRKNVVTALDNARVPANDIAALVGHERQFTTSVYSKGLELPALADIVEKIKYPGLRLTHL